MSASLLTNGDGMSVDEENYVSVMAFLASTSHLFLNATRCPWSNTVHRMWYVKPRSIHWWPKYIGPWSANNLAHFKSFFLLPRALFKHLKVLLGNSLTQGDIPQSLLSVRGHSFPVDRKVAIALMRLATSASLCVVSKQFGCGISTISAIVDSFVDALLAHMQDFLKWSSTPMEMLAVKVGMEAAQGLPKDCGAIDCTHIQMEAPPNDLTTN
ncbi:hypothetical protein L7F22_014201 [Adiantum nelumboides]|nr:hypothetical protein [Adiantum nelumboides]